MPLWISDNPVVLHNSLPFGDIGLKERGTDVYYPVSKDLMIAFMCPSYLVNLQQKYPAHLVMAYVLKFFLHPMPMADENVRLSNLLQTSHSSRFLYAATNDFTLAADFLNENPDYKNQKATISVGEIGKGPGGYSKMPDGFYRVVYGKRDTHQVKIEVIEQDVTITFTSEDTQGMKRIENDAPYERVRVFNNGMLCKHLGAGSLRKKTDNGMIIYEFGYDDPSFEEIIKSIVGKRRIRKELIVIIYKCKIRYKLYLKRLRIDISESNSLIINLIRNLQIAYCELSLLYETTQRHAASGHRGAAENHILAASKLVK